ALHLTAPSLILFGERDQVIPPRPVCRMLRELPNRPPGAWRFALYPKGYHMLLRDFDGELVLADIASWMRDRAAALPSGAGRLAADPHQAAAHDLPICRKLDD